MAIVYAVVRFVTWIMLTRAKTKADAAGKSYRDSQIKVDELTQSLNKDPLHNARITAKIAPHAIKADSHERKWENYQSKYEKWVNRYKKLADLRGYKLPYTFGAIDIGAVIWICDNWNRIYTYLEKIYAA
jgi:hypothetical protein